MEPGCSPCELHSPFRALPSPPNRWSRIYAHWGGALCAARLLPGETKKPFQWDSKPHYKSSTSAPTPPALPHLASTAPTASAAPHATTTAEPFHRATTPSTASIDSYVVLTISLTTFAARRFVPSTILSSLSSPISVPTSSAAITRTIASSITSL